MFTCQRHLSKPIFRTFEGEDLSSQSSSILFYLLKYALEKIFANLVMLPSPSKFLEKFTCGANHLLPILTGSVQFGCNSIKMCLKNFTCTGKIVASVKSIAEDSALRASASNKKPIQHFCSRKKSKVPWVL